MTDEIVGWIIYYLTSGRAVGFQEGPPYTEEWQGMVIESLHQYFTARVFANDPRQTHEDPWAYVGIKLLYFVYEIMNPFSTPIN